MKRFTIVMGLVLFAAVLLGSGCGFGKDKMLFFTDTSFGLDLDSEPPKTSVAFTRKEGVLGPQYNNSEVLPVLATYRKDPIGFFATGQSYSVGKAAVIMAEGFGKPDDYSAQQVVDFKDSIDFSIEANQISAPKGYKKPYVFATNTNLGFDIKWGPTDGAPRAISLGYRRQELSITNVNETINATTLQGQARTASLISISDVEVSLPNAAMEAPKTTIGQFFATGAAANALAANANIRNRALSKAFVAEDMEKVAENQMKEQLEREKQKSLGLEILSLYNTMDNNKKNSLRESAMKHGLIRRNDEPDFMAAMRSRMNSLPERTEKLNQLLANAKKLRDEQ